MSNIQLGKFLAQLRMEKNLTQEQLSEMLHIDKRKVSRWECGNTAPEFDLLIKLSEIFDVTLYEISICQRLKNPSLVEMTKTKLKTIKDLKKYNYKKRIFLFLTIIIGIFFGLTTIYTINNYHKVEIYAFESMDANFEIQGNYIKAKDYEMINIMKLGFIGENEDDLNIEVYDVEYEILNKAHKITHISESKQQNDKIKHVNLLNTVNTINFIKDDIDIKLDDADILSFKIKYKDNQDKNNYIDFQFKLTKKFNN